MPNARIFHVRTTRLRAIAMRVLGATAILIGLLAMHALGSAPADAAAHSAMAVEASHAMPEPAAPTDHHAVGPTCDTECMTAMLGCAMVAIGCVALVALSVLAFLALRRGTSTAPRTAWRSALERIARRSPPHRRPDLVALSISRT